VSEHRDVNAGRNDATQALTLAGQSIMEELLGRLETDLPESDLVAIGTAVTKGISRAFRIGAAFVEDGVRQQANDAGLGLDFNVVVEDAELAEADLWAEQYGSDDP